MKVKTIYQCEKCFFTYDNAKAAKECEAKCLGLTYNEREEYWNLLSSLEIAKTLYFAANNERNAKILDECENAVADFEKAHGLCELDRISIR